MIALWGDMGFFHIWHLLVAGSGQTHVGIFGARERLSLARDKGNKKHGPPAWDFPGAYAVNHRHILAPPPDEITIFLPRSNALFEIQLM